MNIKLDGKVAIITGGGSGIGKCTCLAFAQAGASVVVADINPAVIDETVALIQQRGGKAFGVKVDVSNSEQVRDMVRKTVEHFGRLDVLYNHAGISPSGSVTETSEDLWEKCLAIDLRSVFLGAKFAIPEMQKVGGGVILNTAGTLGMRPSKHKAVYSAAKAGVINLTQSLAIDYAKDNIRCNAISPGFVDTPLNVNVSREEVQEMLERFQPLPGLIKDADIAAMAVFLASDQAKMITGQNFVVDAGQQAGLY